MRQRPKTTFLRKRNKKGSMTKEVIRNITWEAVSEKNKFSKLKGFAILNKANPLFIPCN